MDIELTRIQWILFYSLICVVIPTLTVLVGIVIILWRGQKFVTRLITPDLDVMQTSFIILKAKHPEQNTEKLVRRIIRRQSLRCGVVGAVTGLAGLATLPIALPVDIVMSYRIQAAMVTFIARAYDHDPKMAGEDAMMSSIVLYGTREVTERISQNLLRVAVNVFGKTLAKIIPLIGALIGFVVNFVTTQTTGRLAMGYYSGSISELGVGASKLIRRNEDPPNTV